MWDQSIHHANMIWDIIKDVHACTDLWNGAELPPFHIVNANLNFFTLLKHFCSRAYKNKILMVRNSKVVKNLNLDVC